MAIEFDTTALLGGAGAAAESSCEAEMNAAADAAAGMLDAKEEVEEAETESESGETEATQEDPSNATSETNEPPSETKAEATETPVEDEETRRQRADELFKIRIQQLTQQVADCAMEQAKAREAAKAAKKMFDYAVEKLELAIEDGPDYSVSVRQPTLFDSQETESSPTAETPEPSEPAIDPDAWKAEPITCLKIKPKLLEALQDAGLDTVGQLEELRARISEHRAKWPKGIGVAKITEIEDAMELFWKKQQSEGCTLVKASETIQPGDACEFEEEEEEVDETNDSSNETAEPSNETAGPSDDEIDQLDDEMDISDESIIARRDAMMTNGTLHHPQHADRRYFTSGFEGQQRGFELTDCPYTPGEEQDEWIRGWSLSEFNDHEAMRKSREGSQGLPRSSQVSIDDI